MHSLVNLEGKERANIQMSSELRKLPEKLLNIPYYLKLKSTEQVVQPYRPGLEFQLYCFFDYVILEKKPDPPELQFSHV